MLPITLAPTAAAAIWLIVPLDDVYMATEGVMQPRMSDSTAPFYWIFFSWNFVFFTVMHAWMYMRLFEVAVKDHMLGFGWKVLCVVVSCVIVCVLTVHCVF
jgi:hypothetical protein